MNFTVYNSSAGSGKTFTLVSEYLTLALNDQNRYQNILAITFTNKAANEMKQRILSALREIANPREFQDSTSVNYLLPLLTKKTGLDAAELSKRSEQVLTSILHNYSEFAISTIDSFVHRVIKNFAFDLKIPMNFEVEMDTDSLLQKAIDLLISRIGYDAKLTEYLINFTRSKTDDEKSWSIELDLLEVAKMLLLEDGQTHINRLKNLSLDDFSKIIKTLIVFTRKFEKEITSIAGAGHSSILNSHISPASFYHGTRGIAAYFENLAEGNMEKIIPNSYVISTIDEGKWYSGKASQRDKNLIDGIKSELLERFHEISTVYNAEYRQYLTFQEILKNIYPLAILNEIEKIIREYKDENDILLISEFNQRIAEVVLNEPVPFIYERLGERYKHFLIDEFQDTSYLQWNNFLPLIDNALSEGNFNLIVGDGKQAIYRWRNGNVEQFTNLPKIPNTAEDPIIVQREQALERNFELKKLTTNFRSAKTIVDFNNSLFSYLSQKLDDSFASIYEDVKQNTIIDKDGFIQLQFFDRQNSEISFADFNQQQILSIIRDVQTYDFQLKDIAVLCRSNIQANLIASALLSENIHVVSSESMLVSGSPEVRLLMASVKLLTNHQDDVSKVEILNWISNRANAAKNLHQLLTEADIGTVNRQKKDKTSLDFFDYLSGLGYDLQPGKLLPQSTYEIIEEIARVFGLLKEADPYILFFMDAIFNESSKDGFDLPDLVKWWETKKLKLSIVVPDGLNAVKVMTIHKAKGLEFPVVIFPFAIQNLKTKNKLWASCADSDLEGLASTLVNSTNSLDDTIFGDVYSEEKNKSMLDLINLLYVTLTRPSHQLYILSQTPPKNAGESISVPIMLKGFLETQNLWKEEELTYTFGEKTIFLKTTSDNDKTIIPESIISNRWFEKIHLSLRAPMQWNSESPGEIAEKGSLVHLVLSEISTADELEPVLQKFKNNGTITEVEMKQMFTELERFINHNLVNPFFSDRYNALNEPEIIHPDGQVLRPDRLLFAYDKIYVIDFKTGKHQPGHEKQLKNYIETMKLMDSRRIEGVLLYVYDQNPVVYVSL